MFRKALSKQYIGMNKEFRFRGEEPGRLENLSDGVFALAITLLLISTNAPTSFEEIKRFVWELLPFCACIILIILIWHEHFVFFYRYGLRNTSVIVLNTIFLIIVLFYVYPLKFLCRFLILLVLGRTFGEVAILEEVKSMLDGQNTGQFMIIYGIGAASIFFILGMMYRYALKNKHALDLSRIEEFDTRTSMGANFLMAFIPCLSVAAALVLMDHPRVGLYSGFVYFLYTPIMFVYHARKVKRRTRVLTETMDVNSKISEEELP